MTSFPHDGNVHNQDALAFFQAGEEDVIHQFEILYVVQIKLLKLKCNALLIWLLLCSLRRCFTSQRFFNFWGWIRATTRPRGCSSGPALLLLLLVHTALNQKEPGGQTCCPLRLIYCCSKETLTADHRQVRRVLLSAAWRAVLNLLLLFVHPHSLSRAGILSP